MPDDLVYIQPRDDGVRHGSSLSALVELAEKRGYVLVETTLFNAFFVDRPLYELYLREEVPDVTVEALHECTMTTDLYQLYDGTIKLSGCKRMLWHRMPLEEKRMQMIPEDKRTFPFAPSGGTASDREADRSILDAAVDMSAYCAPLNSDDAKDGTKKTRAECASDLLSQLKRDGFALVRGTGVSSELCRDALTSTGAFLNDADESVRRSCLTEDRARRGYSPMCTENFASLVGENGPNDLVRKFRVGPIVERAGEEGGGGESSSDDARNGDAESSGETLSSPLLRPNVWPDPDVWGEESSRSFRMSIESFYGESCRVAHEVVRAICDGLALAAATKTKTQTAADNGDGTGGDSLEERVGVLSMKDSVEHTSILTLLGYRVGTRHKKKRGKSGEEYPLVAAHTDVGVITLLLFDAGNCASLQRAAGNKKEDGGAGPQSWEDVSLPRSVGSDPVFVVNVGDCMSELCDGELPSTLHRVVPRRGGSEPRNCLALFVGLDPGETVLLPSGERITYEEWRRRRIARATEVLKLKK
uniref:Fe2OG dioxygenase domain-containing protein n=1 Tax=Odontella aurita TaxID=265563 RepID=A0A7S4MYP3_9STRA